ncbi:H-NS family nucleoid-associated regulatory protein [Roseateles cavernae]|uniref:H-NS histone family protein n=1 Tax=Roseateles cavernae TaxID=3153578 RepID=UPI0032E3F2B4
MVTSISKLHAQIAKLQKQADDLKQSAMKRVQREIELHGLTAEDLFGAGKSVERGRKASAVKKAKPTGATTPRAPKYGDKAGNSWGGMGKRPQWLKDALDGGATLESFLLSGETSKSSKQKTAAAKPEVAGRATTKGAAKRKVVAKRASAKPVAKPAVKASVTRKLKPKLKRATAKPVEAAAE